jgi:hypothetical protein
MGLVFTFPGICSAQNNRVDSRMDNRVDTIGSDAPELARYGTFAVGVKTVKLSHRQQLGIAKYKAGAPMPAPLETCTPVAHLNFVPAEHYSDAVWDSVRMNNIAQHFATAFLGKYLQSDAALGSYLTVVENAKDGKFSAAKDGSFKHDHSLSGPQRRGLALGAARALRDRRPDPVKRRPLKLEELSRWGCCAPSCK